MKKHTENCITCGQELVYFETARAMQCQICGKQNESNTACAAGHYVCDACHAERGFLGITRLAGGAASCNPVEIVDAMMRDSSINMHGPEHHYLIVAALLAAYANAGGVVELGKALHNAEQRAKKVPGGICGMWGSCGAGIATGIFTSLITGASPLSEREWSLANRMTSRSLAIIAENGGPRCCKRNTYLAVTHAVGFVKETFGIAMEVPEQIACEFSHRNKQCRKEKCLYHPEYKKTNAF